jgi:hypothetical protein
MLPILKTHPPTTMNIKSLALMTGIAVSGISAGGAFIPAQAVLIVTPLNNTATQQTNNAALGTTLGNSLIGTGITATGISYTGAGQAAGTFSGGASVGLGIDQGIILTTGKAASAPGPNSSVSTTTINNVTGDASLTTLAGAGSTTFDASVLNFNFTTDTGNVLVNFVFASEEYPEYVNQGFGDVFAFYIDGVNIALVPGTTTPVSIDTINNGLNNSGVSAQNPSLYIPNPAGAAGLQYDGYTTTMTAQALGLSAGSHTIKIAIADVGDAQYDSAVFLQTKSFSSTATAKIPEPFTIVGSLIGGGAAFGIRKKLKATSKA